MRDEAFTRETERRSGGSAARVRDADLKVLCLTCWIEKKYGEPYPATHTGLGPYCPADRWGRPK